MNYLKKRNIKNRINFKKLEIKILRSKYILNNRNIEIPIRLAFYYRSQKRKIFLSKGIEDRCVLTYKSTTASNPFNLSSTMFREYALHGNLYGISKSSW